MQSDARPALKVDLRLFSTRSGLPGGDDKGGRGFLLRAVWFVVNAAVFQSRLMFPSGFKCALLRLFGATVGESVIIKPAVNIKYPWFLTIGDHTWIGENAWLDCLSHLTLGSHVIVSQGAYLVCGTHDWEDPGMGNVISPIIVEDGVWIASHALIAGNVTIGQEAMVAMGSVVFNDCEPRMIYRGNPAQKVARRRIRDYPGPRRSPVRPATEPTSPRPDAGA